jgi:hypothetical protein
MQSPPEQNGANVTIGDEKHDDLFITLYFKNPVVQSSLYYKHHTDGF